MKKFHSHKKQN